MIIFIFAFVLCGVVSAATVQSSQITTKTSNQGIIVYNQINPAISGNRVVWEENHYSAKSVIYIKNIVTGDIGRVLPSKYNQSNPDISGTRIVWEQKFADGSSAIYMKNLATGSYGKVLKSTHNQYNPSINGTRVVWEQLDSTGHSVIYYKNLANGFNYRVFKTNDSQYSPEISGTRVVWSQINTKVSAIYVKNVATGIYSILTTNSSHIPPSIDGMRVVWQQDTSTGSIIFVKNLATGITGELKPVGSDNILGGIYGVNVVWISISHDMEIGSFYSIIMKNLHTQITSCVVDNAYAGEPSFDISGSRLVWSEVTYGTFKLYLKNLVTKNIAPLTP